MSDASTAVLQVLPRLESGGVERGTVEIALGLKAAGWRSFVAAEPGRLVPELEAAGVRYVELPLASKNPMVIWQNAKRLEEIVRAERIDVVHARSRAPAWSALRAARRAQVPFVTTFHSIYSGYEQAVKQRYNAVMTKGDRVIAISDYVAGHVQSHYAVAPERVRVIPRAVDLELFDPAMVDDDRRAALRARWDLAPGQSIVMLPGRVTRRKGHLELLRALKRLGRDDVICVMVGPAEAGESYKKQVDLFARTARLDRQVLMTGQCDDMPAALSLADVVAVPSIETPEAFGRVSIEAQAMGKPVVVHSIGGLPETIMPAATGWLVEPGDTEQLAEALTLALAMPAEVRARTAVRARSFVAERFALERMVASTLDVYREVVPGAPSAPVLQR